MDWAYVRLKIARTEGMSGSIIDVMNPQAKKRVVTATKAARRSGFADCMGGRRSLGRLQASGIGKRLATDGESGRRIRPLRIWAAAQVQ